MTNYGHHNSPYPAYNLQYDDTTTMARVIGNSMAGYHTPYAPSPPSPFVDDMTSSKDAYLYSMTSSDDGYNSGDSGSSISSPIRSPESYDVTDSIYHIPYAYNDVTLTKGCHDDEDDVMTSSQYTFSSEHLPTTVDDFKTDPNCYNGGSSILQQLEEVPIEDLPRLLNDVTLGQEPYEEVCENEIPPEVRELCQNYSNQRQLQQNQDHQYHQQNYDYHGYMHQGIKAEPASYDDTPLTDDSHYTNNYHLPSPNGLYPRHHNHLSESSTCSSNYSNVTSIDDSIHGDEGYYGDGYYDSTGEDKKKQRHTNRGRRRHSSKKGKLLWQFMIQIMTDKRYRNLAVWTDREKGTFRIIQSKQIAKLWGQEKNNKDMNYEKMSRALRFLRDNGHLVMPKPSKRLHFQFSERILKMLK